jgi:hypothetical protein
LNRLLNRFNKKSNKKFAFRSIFGVSFMLS